MSASPFVSPGPSSRSRGAPRRTLLAAALLVFAVTGCGGRDERPAIRFVSLAWQEQAVETVRGIVAEWNADTTHLPVEYVQGTWGAVHDYLITSFETGEVPDVFHYESVNIVDFADHGYLTDLRPVLSDSLVADLHPAGWAAVVREDGGVYGVPFLLESLIILYNRDLFARAGVAPPTVDQPWTWDDLRAAARRLTRDADGDGTPEQWGAAFGLRNSANIVLNLTLGFGGGYFRQVGGRPAVAVGEPEKALLGTIHAMLYRDRTAAPAGVGQSGPGMIPGFLAGDYAMLVGIGAWARQQVVENAPEGFAWGVLPPVRARTQHQGANAQTLSIPTGAAHPEEALAFVEFFMSRRNVTRLAESDWMPPARRSCLQAPVFAHDGVGWKTTVATLDHLVQGPWNGVPGYTEWRIRIANPTFQEVFSDRLTVDEAARRIEEESARVLRRYHPKEPADEAAL